jgi:NTE family protein
MDIVIALGGGGSRGFAHVGVLRRLEQEGYHIRAAAGTSAGGIIAALYAAGYSPDEMEARFTELDQSKLFGRTSKDGPGLLGLSGAEKVLENYFGTRRFEDLKLLCAVVAVDLQTGREVILSQGRVVDAIMATIAVPGIFPPKEYQGKQLVDGAVLNPVPVSIARLLAPNLPVVAVVLDEGSSTDNGFPNIPLYMPVPAPIVKSLTRTRVAQAFGIFLKSVDVSSRELAEMRLLEDNPEVIIRPDVGGIGILDNVNVSKIVRLGEKAVEEALPDLKRALTWPNRLRRKVIPKRP